MCPVNIVGSDQPSLPSGTYTKERGAQSQNGPAPSSLGMGENINWANGPRQLIKALDLTPPGGDPALAAIKGGKSPDAAGSWQTREVAPGNVKAGPSMHAPEGSPSGKVAGKLGKS